MSAKTPAKRTPAKRAPAKRSRKKAPAKKAPPIPMSGIDPEALRDKLRNAKRIRVISIDGGGLYGLFAGIWLNQMCRANPSFLGLDEDEDVHFFAGTSAGAVTSLLASAQENPRNAFYDEHAESLIERFWQEPGLYKNQVNPVDSVLSRLMMTAYLGRDDELQVLDQYFREGLEMRDLRPVIASTYNWSGGKPNFKDPKDRPPFPYPTDWNVPRPPWTQNMPNADFPNWMRPPAFPWKPMWEGFMKSMFGGPFPMDVRSQYKWAAWANFLAIEPKEIEQTHKHGHWPPNDSKTMHPWLFTNFSGPQDWWDLKVRDIAYGATAMPTVRPVRGGIGDGAIFNANPSVDALSAIIWHYHGGLGPLDEDHDFDRNAYFDDLKEVLNKTSMLSIGPGAKMPAYWMEDFNLGALPYMKIPVDPTKGSWAPSSYGLNQPIQAATMNAHTLLGGNFHRLNPPLMEIPPGPVLYYVRNDSKRNAIIEQMKQLTHGRVSRAAVEGACEFVASDAWKG